MKTVGSVLLFVIVLTIGISIQVNKIHNCTAAGWEYHFWTEQCLPKARP